VRNHITLLRAPTLAAFLPWGSSEGASCMTLTDRKNTVFLNKCKRFRDFLSGKNSWWVLVVSRVCLKPFIKTTTTPSPLPGNEVVEYRVD